MAEVISMPAAEIDRVLAGVGPRGAIARGCGRAYGDAALNAGGAVLNLTDEDLVLDESSGLLRVAAGVTIDEILRQCVPRGWFIPVSPGTRYVTIGGAIAANVHGKNHHADGSFGRWVRSIVMVLADGSTVTVDPQSDPDLWWATIGGMGLTGAITSAVVQMIPIETSRCLVDTVRAADLDELMAEMERGDERYRYSVAWIDLVASGAHLGRGVLTSGDFARRDQIPYSVDELHYDPRHLASVPRGMPNLLNRAGIRVFNEAYFRSAPRRRVAEVQPIARFFHPLDAVGNWNRLYGRRGFIQYQFVVPFEQHQVVRRAIERIVVVGRASFLAVLKRFGEADPSMLGFPMPGWTLTLDVPAVPAVLAGLVVDLDEMVLEAGGRVYLAKDAVATPQMIRATYPHLERWKAVRDRVDPDRVWNSDLSRRLEL
jgi:decaprenylphospho-beta-D-ribofuranose 2-oxidase